MVRWWLKLKKLISKVLAILGRKENLSNSTTLHKTGSETLYLWTSAGSGPGENNGFRSASAFDPNKIYQRIRIPDFSCRVSYYINHRPLFKACNVQGERGGGHPSRSTYWANWTRASWKKRTCEAVTTRSPWYKFLRLQVSCWPLGKANGLK